MPRPETGTDTYVYNALDKIIPTFCKYNIHPNVITIGSILSNKVLFEALKNIPKNKALIFGLILSHTILDCLDGELARGCKKQTKIGSYLDGLNDSLFFSIIFMKIFSKYKVSNYSTQNIIKLLFLFRFVSYYVFQVDQNTHESTNKLYGFLHDNYCLLTLFLFFIL